MEGWSEVRIETAFIANTIQTRPDRRLDIGGIGVNAIGALRFPIVLPGIAVFARLRLNPSDTGKTHSVRAMVLDSSGRTVRSARAIVRPEPGWEVDHVVIRITKIRISMPGTYRVAVRVGDEIYERMRFEIADATA